MRQRTTFLTQGSAEFDPGTLHVTRDSFTVEGLTAGREDRLTIPLNELPEELQAVVSQCRELYIRWTSPDPYKLSPPLFSRMSPGLHVFMTPRRRTPPTFLCGVLKKAFGSGLQCDSALDAFTYLPHPPDRPPATPRFQYYQFVQSIDDLVIYIQQTMCPKADRLCHERAQTLSDASYVDINYDNDMYELTITAFRAGGHRGTGLWNEEIPRTNLDRLEIGILAQEHNSGAEEGEISLGGWLTVVGEDTKPKPTLFSIPSRHQPIERHSSHTFTTHFIPPTGLHPTLRLTLPSAPLPPSSSNPTQPPCSFHAYLVLPSFLFPDRYQLSDPLFLASINLKSIRALHGPTDLEAPDWVIPTWGSALLLDLAIGSAASKSPWTIDIPLHLRYLPPINNDTAASGKRIVNVPHPVLFWACPRAEEVLPESLSENPFDRRFLGFDTLFEDGTRFSFLEGRSVPGPGSQGMEKGTGLGLAERLSVPVLDMRLAGGVERWTVVVVIMGMVWVVLKALGVSVAVRFPGRSIMHGTEEGKKWKRKKL